MCRGSLMDTASVCRGAATLHKKGAATSESYAKASSRASPIPRSATNAPTVGCH